MLQQSIGESEEMLRLLGSLVVVYSYALISCRQIPRGITLTAHFFSSKHHPMELSEGAPPLIWSTWVASGAVSHTVVDVIMLRAHLWFYNRRI